MLAALIIVFREVLEAGLIIGVVLAASRGVPGRGRAVGLGVLAGLVGSVIVALFAAEISQAFAGRGQEIFNASVLLLAVVMLTWHVVWMASHAREMTARLKELGHAVAAGSRSVVVLGVAVASAVMREGSEVVLFLSGILMQGTANATALALGSAGGLVFGAADVGVVCTGLMVVPLRRVFTVMGVLVTLLAAVSAAEAVRQLSMPVLSLCSTERCRDTWLASLGEQLARTVCSCADRLPWTADDVFEDVLAPTSATIATITLVMPFARGLRRPAASGRAECAPLGLTDRDAASQPTPWTAGWRSRDAPAAVGALLQDRQHPPPRADCASPRARCCQCSLRKSAVQLINRTLLASDQNNDLEFRDEERPQCFSILPIR